MEITQNDETNMKVNEEGKRTEQAEESHQNIPNKKDLKNQRGQKRIMEDKESRQGKKQEGKGTKEARTKGSNDQKGKRENNESAHTKKMGKRRRRTGEGT